MNEKALGLLGLMRRANAIAIGETNTGAAVKAGRAKLLLLAADASENARHRAEGFLFGHSAILVPLPCTKNEISAMVGVGGCSMAAVTDLGFANALMKALETESPLQYAEAAQEVERRLTKEKRRRKETPVQEKTRGRVKGGQT